ncbi:bifunctional hydroxymethylpyrimidine kinase/phosphomethylpyrimidine kinase [Nocardioides pinisoli]|uniref:Bifunctional hydroxymethylpyrimidine kinase/phosphomethylpyrimidine kinase n=1 Tax=Nocardioides pinisoli TaxID=2950279 RepID=A0ABT1L305_9ACTN|nr:bifunctional hydroxymethylpyrimidine kinase/phosphomethylpyrimidine kinase [Nocardioides pinisoli]MCP3424411.1 bifunctional hydroxymethylpyrimidine kinase/phosphomethylpyrimidine kinase [Nocardioides pinisoli]
MPVEIVAQQVDAVLADLPVAVVKTGMLGSPDVVRLVAGRLGQLPLVVDPVLVATSGAVLGDDAVVAAYCDHLLPTATVATPNLDEARALTYASALAARLAHGDVLAHAANSAAAYVADRLDDSSGWGLGRGRGPVSHLAPSRPATRVGPWRAAGTSGTGDRSRDGCGCRSSG